MIRLVKLGRSAVLVLLALAGLAGSAGAAEARASWLTSGDRSVLRSVSPRGLELLEAGEAARLAGDDVRALSLYAQADDVYKMREEPLRFTCKRLAELGRREEALAACQKALDHDKTEAALATQVGAMMVGKGRLAMDDLLSAERTTRALLTRSPNQPWGYAAKGDIARRIGDFTMLENASQELRRRAPDHYETARIAALVTARSSRTGALFGWLAFAGLCALTGLHALRRRVRRGATPRAAAALTVLAMLGGARAASAEEASEAPPASSAGAEDPNITHGLSKWGVDNTDPERTLPTTEQRDRNPLEYGYHLMDIGERADLAVEKQDYAGAIKYYRALAKAVPDMSISWVKICEMYDKLGRRDEALEACGTALTKENLKLENYELYGRAVLSKRGNLTPEEAQNLGAVVDHLKTQEPAQRVAARLECDLGVRMDDVKRLESCTAVLAKTAPDAATTVTYQWSFAMQQKRYDDALALVERAKKVGVPPAGVTKMRDATYAALPLLRQPLRLALVGTAALGAIVALGILIRRRRPVSPSPAVPATAPSS